jgi:hypothetical protein
MSIKMGLLCRAAGKEGKKEEVDNERILCCWGLVVRVRLQIISPEIGQTEQTIRLVSGI